MSPVLSLLIYAYINQCIEEGNAVNKTIIAEKAIVNFVSSYRNLLFKNKFANDEAIEQIEDMANNLLNNELIIGKLQQNSMSTHCNSYYYQFAKHFYITDKNGELVTTKKGEYILDENKIDLMIAEYEFTALGIENKLWKQVDATLKQIEAFQVQEKYQDIVADYNSLLIKVNHVNELRKFLLDNNLQNPEEVCNKYLKNVQKDWEKEVKEVPVEQKKELPELSSSSKTKERTPLKVSILNIPYDSKSVAVLPDNSCENKIKKTHHSSAQKPLQLGIVNISFPFS